MLLKQLEEPKGGKITTVLTVQRSLSVKVSFEAENWLKTSKLSTKQSKKQPATAKKELYVTNLTITTTQGVGIAKLT